VLEFGGQGGGDKTDGAFSHGFILFSRGVFCVFVFMRVLNGDLCALLLAPRSISHIIRSRLAYTAHLPSLLSPHKFLTPFSPQPPPNPPTPLTHPPTTAQCPRESCEGTEAFYHQIQIRSADEPMTTFYKVSSPSQYTPLVLLGPTPRIRPCLRPRRCRRYLPMMHWRQSRAGWTQLTCEG